MTAFVRAGMLLAAGAACLLADFSYQETARLTGGLMAGMMKVVGVFSKQAREPVRSTILVKGDRMATLTATAGHIVDLEKETITEIDFQKKTYSVVSFAEIAQAMKEAEARMATEQGEQVDIKIKASVQPTGQTKTFSGVEARQVLLNLEMEGTNKKTGERGVFMTITSEMWMAQVPGYQEVLNFHRRAAQKLAWTPGATLVGMQRSEVSKGMAELYKEAAKLDGVAVYQVIKMGLKGEPGSEGATAEAQPRAPQSEEQPSVGGALGRLGGLGRLGRLGRRKEPEQPRPAESAPAAGPGAAPTLMEMVSEAGDFSTAPIDPGRLSVPAGFQQVESDLVRGLRSRRR